MSNRWNFQAIAKEWHGNLGTMERAEVAQESPSGSLAVVYNNVFEIKMGEVRADLLVFENPERPKLLFNFKNVVPRNSKEFNHFQGDYIVAQSQDFSAFLVIDGRNKRYTYAKVSHAAQFVPLIENGALCIKAVIQDGGHNLENGSQPQKLADFDWNVLP